MWYGMVSITSIWGYSNPWQSQGSGHEIIRVLHVTQTCKGKGQEPHCRLLSTFSTDSSTPGWRVRCQLVNWKICGETQSLCRFWWYVRIRWGKMRLAEQKSCSKDRNGCALPRPCRAEWHLSTASKISKMGLLILEPSQKWSASDGAAFTSCLTKTTTPPAMTSGDEPWWTNWSAIENVQKDEKHWSLMDFGGAKMECPKSKHSHILIILASEQAHNGLQSQARSGLPLQAIEVMFGKPVLLIESNQFESERRNG